MATPPTRSPTGPVTVSWIHSSPPSLRLYAEGMVLFNRAGRGFLTPGLPTITRQTPAHPTAIGTRSQPVIIGGTPGGDFQPQCGLQILTSLIDFGLDPQAAVEAPRWWSFPGTDPETLYQEMALRVESEMPESTQHGLAALGHRLAPRQPGIYDGKVQLIVRDPDRGVLMGASDPRGDGHAASW